MPLLLPTKFDASTVPLTDVPMKPLIPFIAEPLRKVCPSVAIEDRHLEVGGSVMVLDNLRMEGKSTRAVPRMVVTRIIPMIYMMICEIVREKQRML
jgi:hypothetical protein